MPGLDSASKWWITLHPCSNFLKHPSRDQEFQELYCVNLIVLSFCFMKNMLFLPLTEAKVDFDQSFMTLISIPLFLLSTYVKCNTPNLKLEI